MSRPCILNLLALASILLAPSIGCASAPFDSTAALAKARALRPAVSSGDAATLWREFDAPMRAAMKDSANFAVMTVGVQAQTGGIDSVLSERVERAGDQIVVRTLCRFHKPPQPLAVVLAFDADGRVSGLSIRPEGPPKEWPSTFLDYTTKTSLRLPFRGEWVVFWGGRTMQENHHAAVRSQRFAYDLLIVRDDSTHRGDGKQLADYYSYGEPVLAPAAGTIVRLEDGRPDQEFGTTDPAQPAGNYIVIDHGDGEFSLLAHLQPGSLQVKKGDHVQEGDVLARCGNSGNTSEPHLHYHLQNGPDMSDADGLPAFFIDLKVDGKAVPRTELLKGQKVQRAH
jgi:murein DD-endopeptidase MepM/ murein hydrolase activator NlpD